MSENFIFNTVTKNSKKWYLVRIDPEYKNVINKYFNLEDIIRHIFQLKPGKCHLFVIKETRKIEFLIKLFVAKLFSFFLSSQPLPNFLFLHFIAASMQVWKLSRVILFAVKSSRTLFSNLSYVDHVLISKNKSKQKFQ